RCQCTGWATLTTIRLNARANDVARSYRMSAPRITGGIRQFTADWTRWTDDQLYDARAASDQVQTDCSAQIMLVAWSLVPSLADVLPICGESCLPCPAH